MTKTCIFGMADKGHFFVCGKPAKYLTGVKPHIGLQPVCGVHFRALQKRDKKTGKARAFQTI